ncbi:MAG: saccharopine dehydrogenase (NAD+, L-lysine-forming) [Saprospiraceae bacterium]|jgi:saccharopine dehydrogenase (NAD+, L-lysine-forming)
MKIGIIKEGKTPPDKRVPFSPEQCEILVKDFGLNLVVQPSKVRCFKDEEYSARGIILQEDLSDCDVLFGVKEVRKQDLIPGKKYFFFSHTIKEQPYNKTLLQTLLKKRIQMVDYECLQDTDSQRILGFGRYAGIVGSYNALLAWGQRTKTFELKPANLCEDMAEITSELQKINVGNIKITLSGNGRVAHGAMELLELAGVTKANPEEYINETFDKAVYTQMKCHHYYSLQGEAEFSYPHFYKNSAKYKVNFLPYLNPADIFISCHYWDNESGPLFTIEDCTKTEFKTKVIADITCDIQGSVPTTLRSTTIAHPLFGFDPKTNSEVDPFDENGITIMAVDNLPCELPKDASKDFGTALINDIIPELLNEDKNNIINRASICLDGKLNSYYNYLKAYAR